jgi:hypothetical protein
MITINNSGNTNMNDAKAGLKKAENVVNKGIMGWITRMFMGKKFTSDMNQAINMGKSTINMVDKRSELMSSGKAAQADVMGIADTGKMVNYDPIVHIKLSVQPESGNPFQVEAEQIVSKIAIPRVGDKVNIKYNPLNSQEFVII